MWNKLYIFLMFLFIMAGCLEGSDYSRNLPGSETSPPEIGIQAEKIKGKGICVTLEISGIEGQEIGKITLFRSTSRLKAREIDTSQFPVTTFALPKEAAFYSLIDGSCADNSQYFYIVEIIDIRGNTFFSRAASAKTDDRKLGDLTSPSLLIDKVHYTLEVQDEGETVKSYPFAMGRKPESRKLYRDNCSTPEGVYEIINLQPQATYYKAYDLNYPNEIDEFRYQFSVDNSLLPRDDGEPPGIGGEIQIHGKSIGSNWTAGCITLRKKDIDELFSHSEIASGTTVIITGCELTRADLDSIGKVRSEEEIRLIQAKILKIGFNPGTIDGVLGERTMNAIGLFQKAKNLPITCQLDRRTVEALEMIKLDTDELPGSGEAAIQ